MPYSLRPDQIRQEMERQNRKDIRDSLLTIVVLAIMMLLMIGGMVYYALQH